MVELSSNQLKISSSQLDVSSGERKMLAGGINLNHHHVIGTESNEKTKREAPSPARDILMFQGQDVTNSKGDSHQRSRRENQANMFAKKPANERN